MTGVQPNPRIGWLDGLRGLAAPQVVTCHYALAFLPALGSADPQLARYAWERAFIGTPFGLLFDGSSAVYLFFIISGVALTHIFSGRALDVRSAIMRRLIRLSVPMTVAMVFAASLFLVVPDVTGLVVRQTGSVWFGHVGPRDLSAPAIVHQIAFEGLLTGYRSSSPLPGWAVDWLGLIPRDQGLDAPLWTLHIEFYGSLLVLLLVAVRPAGHRTVYLLVSGLPDDAEVLRKMLGSCLTFGGLACLAILRRQLTRPAMRWLDKISFSLYLTHFPLLFTGVAAAFERWIDAPAIVLSRGAGRFWRRPATVTRAA